MPKCPNCEMEYIDDGDGNCSSCRHPLYKSPSSASNKAESINGRGSDGKESKSVESSENSLRKARITDPLRFVPPRIGLLAFVVLAIFGLGGHYIGLRTIGSYSEVRSDIRGSEQLINELKTSITGFTQERSQISAARDAAQTELNSLQSQVTVAKTTETLALDSTRRAQEDMAKARQSRLDAVYDRDSAIAARDKANSDKAGLLTAIESLTTQEVSLKQSVQTLEVSRANLDTTLRSLARESQTLSDIRKQLDTARNDLANVEQRSAVAQERLAIAQTTQAAADSSQADIQALTTQRSQLNGIVAELQSQIEKANETLAITTTLVSQNQTIAAAADGQLVSAQREQGILDKEISNLQVKRDQMIPQIELLETQVNKLRGTISGLETHLSRLRTDEIEATSRVSEATILAGSIVELTGRRDKLQTEVDSFSASRATLQSEVSALDAEIKARGESISQLNGRLQRLREEEISKFQIFERILRSLEAALKASNSINSEDDSSSDDAKEPEEGGD